MFLVQLRIAHCPVALQTNVALLSANQRMSAFELMLQSEDDMLLIRILSKEKSKFFVVDFDRLSFEHITPDLRELLG